ncbi:1,6-anhydro-N-acetylmuramyl-L-alanine amidase AmpD [Collimonas sp.]|jgi:AmpD protein|uniref:1,6-anhydro-N-acetylmuramyl-L-alanine amidase AmpD n=1 Tax=Collimonas sp. TaxID=1963772 RepID=UPI0037BE322C
MTERQSNAGLTVRPHFEVGADGWCCSDEVVRVASPNCDARPAGCDADLLVIHNISLPPGQFGGPYIVDLFSNRLDYNAHPYFEQLRALRVSSHFLILRDGGVVQFVSANERAWHAGVSRFEGRERCNDFSIGIELEGSDVEQFSDLQYQTLATLTHALRLRYPLAAVAGHQHIAPGRKTDPGTFFDWAQYQQALAGHRPQVPGKSQLRFPVID